MRNTILTLSFVLGLTACDDAKKPETTGKDATAKKDVKLDGKAGKKPDLRPSKPDAKTDAKADAKADAKQDTPDTTKPGDDAAPEVPAADALDAEKIGQLAVLARDIAAKPEQADAILEKAGMDRTAFERAMVAVAKDQWKTDLYVTALTQAAQTG